MSGDARQEEGQQLGSAPVGDGPGSEACHQAILAAAVALLEEGPYRGVSIETIAERAGVSKQTIYKWWSSKAALVMEAYASVTMSRVPAPDTGSVEGDLVEVMRRSCEMLGLGQVGRTVAGLIAETVSDAQFAEEFRNTFIGSRRQMVRGLLERGMARGELRADLDLGLAIDMLYGPLWYRLLLRNAPLDEAFARQLVAQLMPGMRAST